jgi:hypothetical protein
MGVSWYGRCCQAGVETETLSVHDAWRAGDITRAEAAAIPPSPGCRDVRPAWRSTARFLGGQISQDDALALLAMHIEHAGFELGQIEAWIRQASVR